MRRDSLPSPSARMPESSNKIPMRNLPSCQKRRLKYNRRRAGRFDSDIRPTAEEQNGADEAATQILPARGAQAATQVQPVRESENQRTLMFDQTTADNQARHTVPAEEMRESVRFLERRSTCHPSNAEANRSTTREATSTVLGSSLIKCLPVSRLSRARHSS